MARANGFRGQSILITGASSGLGEEFARQLASAGANLGLVARRGDKLLRLTDELADRGVKIACQAADVGDRSRLNQAIDSIRHELGIAAFDRAILNAGVGTTFRARDFEAGQVEAILRTNFLGAANTIEAVLPGMIAAGAGHVIGISSLSAKRGLPLGYAYGASKAALTMMLDGLRVELEAEGVDVTVIHPGFIRTPMIADQKTPQPGVLEPTVAVRRMLRAIEKRKYQYDFPFSTAFLTGSLRRMPLWLSHRLLRRFVMPTVEDAEPGRPVQ
ncbi:SDR family NAD(P)-dependent oxidoreductase [bacterium]|nr:SDR family NAD(P)-dependent oxidoreductase [bacterium]